MRKAFQRTLTKQGLKFKLNTKVIGSEVTADGVKLTLEPSKGGESEILECDVVLVSAGAYPWALSWDCSPPGDALVDGPTDSCDVHVNVFGSQAHSSPGPVTDQGLNSLEVCFNLDLQVPTHTWWAVSRIHSTFHAVVRQIRIGGGRSKGDPG